MTKILRSESKLHKTVDGKIEVLKVKETVEQEMTTTYLSVKLDGYYILNLIKADLRSKGVDFDSVTTKAEWHYSLTSNQKNTDFTFLGITLRKVYV